MSSFYAIAFFFMAILLLLIPIPVDITKEDITIVEEKCEPFDGLDTFRKVKTELRIVCKDGTEITVTPESRGEKE